MKAKIVVLGPLVTIVGLLSACGQGIELNGRTIAGTINPSDVADGGLIPRNEEGNPHPHPGTHSIPDSTPGVPTHPGDSINSVDVDIPSAPTFFLDLDFESEQRATQADVVWTIDNSTSMAEEAQNVRVNFDTFVRRLESVSDVKMGLISSSTYNQSAKIFGVKMADDLIAKGHYQFDALATGVGSWNLLAFAAISSCAANRSNVLSDPWDTTICNRRSTNSSGRKLEEQDYVDAARGRMVNFYRPGAKRIYIFVTDDESRHFKSTDFKAVMDSQVPNNYHVFGFVGNSADTRCNSDGTGNDYMSLASDTNGQTFPICDQNWTPHFDTLASSIFRLIEKGYDIPADATVKRVYLDDVELTPSQYVVESDRKLYFKKGVVKQAGQKIKITVSKPL